jgi:GNAT superfamily N-acetyltransferase
MQMLQVGMFALPFKVGFGPFFRLVDMLSAAEKGHKNAISAPHWYLMILAVRPDKQGQGLGKKLLEHGLKRVDGDRLPAYLETSNKRNLPLYERFGFKVVHSGEFAKGGSPFWGMLRERASA